MLSHLIGLLRLHIDLEPPPHTKFNYSADFFVTALEGKANGSIDVTSGIQLEATMDAVDVLGLVQIQYA